MIEDIKILRQKGRQGILEHFKLEEASLEKRKYMLGIVSFAQNLQKEMDAIDLPPESYVAFYRYRDRVEIEFEQKTWKILDDYQASILDFKFNLDYPLPQFKNGDKVKIYLKQNIEEQFISLLFTERMMIEWREALLQVDLPQKLSRAKTKI